MSTTIPAANSNSDSSSLKEGKQKHFGGSQSDQWNLCLVDQVVQALRTPKNDPQAREWQIHATMAALSGIGPRSEIEGMIAAQLLAAHSAAMECYRRAMLSEQSFEGRRENLNQANKLSRTWALLLGALDSHRGKGQQKVTVEHVHVHAGGQAVVGMVETQGEGDRRKSKDQPHAIAHAPGAEMPGSNSEGAPLPVASNGKRPLPDARRTVPGCAEGQQERL